MSFNFILFALFFNIGLALVESRFAIQPTTLATSDSTASFELVTKIKPTGSPISPENSTSYLTGVFIAGAPTKILIHGWLGSKSGPMETDIATAYVTKQNVNAVKVDWSSLAADPSYFPAAANVGVVGVRVAALIDKLIEAGVATLSSIHIVGFSLGAHVAGIAGSNLKAGKIARITGLDPAQPGFYWANTLGRLDPSDAVFVDVIHTCAGSLGFLSPVGHADFYPNGGFPPAPGCETALNLNATLLCSHGRSFQYFNESIYSPTAFRSFKCFTFTLYSFGVCRFNSQGYMGDPAVATLRGLFYLRTNPGPPYGQF